MHQKPESETYFHTATEHKHNDTFDMYKWRWPQRVSEAEYLQQAQNVCDQESRGRTTVGQSLVGTQDIPLSLPKFPLLCHHMINMWQLCLSVLIPKQEHHGKMNSSIWKNFLRICVLSSDPKRFFLQSLSSLGVICTTFLRAKGTHVCKKRTICDKLLAVNGEEEKQCLSQEPAHISSSTPCTGNSGLAPKDQTVPSEPQHSCSSCHWHKLLGAIPQISVILYCQLTGLVQ